MIKLYDEDLTGYIAAEVEDFYCNDFPQFFARIDKDSYVRQLYEPIYTVPEMIYGSKPTDDGNLFLTPEERDELIDKNPAAQKWIRPFVGSLEFIRGKKRYCLWLVDCPPNEIRKMPLVYKRVKLCREARLKGAPDRQKLAQTPWLFREQNNPMYKLVIPKVSSSRREYIPMDFVNEDVILTDLLFMIPGAKYWHFGVLTSSVHMTWMRMVAGRLRNDYRYSSDVVYNNFPFPPFWRKVERTASDILMARSKYPEASFADLYDPLLMPKELRKAHEANDRAVMDAYDFPHNMTEAQMQRALLKLYERLKNFRELYDSLAT